MIIKIWDVTKQRGKYTGSLQYVLEFVVKVTCHSSKHVGGSMVMGLLSHQIPMTL